MPQKVGKVQMGGGVSANNQMSKIQNLDFLIREGGPIFRFFKNVNVDIVGVAILAISQPL